MSSNTIVVSYRDLVFKGLIGDLKQAALSDVKTLCRTSCDRCPNVCHCIDLSQISVAGLDIERIAIIPVQNGELDLHIDAGNIMPWLEKNELVHRKIIHD
ncbi:MAG: hypothetical protein WBM99_00700 [Psychromonas sp.]